MFCLILFASTLSCCLACWAGSSDSSRGNDRWVPFPVPMGGGMGFGGPFGFGRKKREVGAETAEEENSCIAQCVAFVRERTERSIEDVKKDCDAVCDDMQTKWISTIGEIRKEEQEKLQKLLTRQ